MDYAGGYSGDQSAQLASSIESLNGTIAGLKDTVANFGSSLYRNINNVAATSGSFGVGAFQNAYQAATPMMAPQVMEIMPGAFQRPPGGFIHNVLASAGMSGQANAPWGFEMSPQAYQERARERVGKSLYGMYSGVMESFSQSGTASMMADLGIGLASATFGGPVLGAVATVGGLGPLAFGEEKLTGGNNYSWGRYYERYNRQLEGEAAVQGMKLGGRDVSELDKSAYGAAYSRAAVEASSELGKTAGWFGFSAARAASADISASLKESGVEKQILGEDGKLEQDLGKFTERFKEKIKAMVGLAEKLNIDQREAWQMLAKINDTMGAQPGANQQDTVNKFFSQVQRGASAMDMAPMQAYDYMTKMQNIYQQTGTMGKQYWLDAGAYAMQIGGMGVQAGMKSEDALNAAGIGVVGATQMFRGGMVQKMLTRSIVQAGEEGRADLEAVMSEIDTGITKGTINVDSAKKLMEEKLGKYMTPEALAAGAAYYNPSEIAKTTDITKRYGAAQMFLNESQDVLYGGLSAHDIFLTTAEGIKTDMLKDGRFINKDERTQHSDWVKEVATQTRMSVVEAGKLLSPEGAAELRRQNEQAAGMVSLTDMGGGFQTLRGQVGEFFGLARPYSTRDFTADYVKNVIGGKGAPSDVGDYAVQQALSHGDLSNYLTSIQESIKHREYVRSEDLSGIYNLPTDVKKMLVAPGDRGMRIGTAEQQAQYMTIDSYRAAGTDSVRALMAEVATQGDLVTRTPDDIRQAMAKLAVKRDRSLDVNDVYNSMQTISNDQITFLSDPYKNKETLDSYKTLKSRFAEMYNTSPDLVVQLAKNIGAGLEGADNADEVASRIASQFVSGAMGGNQYDMLMEGLQRDTVARIVANPMMQGGYAPVNYQGSDTGRAIVGAITNRQYDRVVSLLDSDQSKDNATMSLADIAAQSGTMSSQSSAAATMMRMYQAMDSTGAASGDTAAVTAALGSRSTFEGFLEKQGVGEKERTMLGGMFEQAYAQDKQVTIDDMRGMLSTALGNLAGGNRVMSTGDLESGAATVAAQKQSKAAQDISTAFQQLSTTMGTLYEKVKALGQ